MSNYFDNQNSWEYHVDGNKVMVTTDHGTHTHTFDIGSIPIGDMGTPAGNKAMGDAHRAATHDKKAPPTKEDVQMSKSWELTSEQKEQINNALQSSSSGKEQNTRYMMKDSNAKDFKESLKVVENPNYTPETVTSLSGKKAGDDVPVQERDMAAEMAGQDVDGGKDIGDTSGPDGPSGGDKSPDGPGR